MPVGPMAIHPMFPSIGAPCTCSAKVLLKVTMSGHKVKVILPSTLIPVSGSLGCQALVTSDLA